MADARNAFNFNRDFTKSGASAVYLDASSRLPVPHAQHAALVEQARQEAHAQGVLEGRALERDEEAARVTAAMGEIVQRLRDAEAHLAAAEQESRREALQFALVFARKMAGKLIDQMPVATIEATARAILSDLRGAPHVAVRVEPGLVDSVKSRLTLLFRENGIELKLFVFPDPAIRLGDCRIEWSEGGIVRDREKLEYLIDQTLDVVLKRV
ncbi:MAG: flagellar assembly protein FliH [Rhizobiales bacterium]|nr:flagellar assembly protein FliH [Hyphomicrobiales bacterium]